MFGTTGKCLRGAASQRMLEGSSAEPWPIVSLTWPSSSLMKIVQLI